MFHYLFFYDTSAWIEMCLKHSVQIIYVLYKCCIYAELVFEGLL